MKYKYGYIYKITNPVGAIYIGQTVRPHIREGNYRTGNTKNQIKVGRSISKYGWDNHKFDIILKFDREKLDIDKVEKLFIKFFNSYVYNNEQYGMNLTIGGLSGKEGQYVTTETREKMSKVRKGVKKPISEEGKENIRKGIKRYWENNRGIVSRKMKEETKQKISVKNKGIVKTFTTEWRANIGLSMKKAYSEGRIISNKGMTHSEESKRRMSEAQLKVNREGRRNSKTIKVVQLTKSGDFVKEWNSITEVSKAMNSGSIWMCCEKRPNFNTAKGYKWVYATEYYKQKEHETEILL
jgi:NUMOD3 motif